MISGISNSGFSFIQAQLLRHLAELHIEHADLLIVGIGLFDLLLERGFVDGEILEPSLCVLELFGYRVDGIVESLRLSLRAVADLDLVGVFALQEEHPVKPGRIVRKVNGERAERAKKQRVMRVGVFGNELQKPFARVAPPCVLLVAERNKIALLPGAGRFEILLKLSYRVLQPVLALGHGKELFACGILRALDARAERRLPLYLGLELYAPLYERVADGEGFDLAVREDDLVDLVAAPGGVVAVDDLRGEALLVFEQLPRIRVEGAVRYVAVDGDGIVPVALAEHTPLSLGDVGGSPRNVEMVHRPQLILHVGANAELESRPDQYPYVAPPDLVEERGTHRVVHGVVHEGDLLRRDAHLDELILHVVVEVEIVLRRGLVEEHELRHGPVRAPYLEHLLGAGVDLRGGKILRVRIDEPHIERRLPAVGGDLEHIVLRAGDETGFDPFRADGKLRDIVAQRFDAGTVQLT